MDHKTIFLALFLILFLASFLYIIKNRPDYLVILGIRGLLSSFLIQLIHSLCTLLHLPVLVHANPVTFCAGSLLGFPGILLLYAVRLYFSSL